MLSLRVRFIWLIFVLVVMPVVAMAEVGRACESPYVVTNGYEGDVSSGEYWFYDVSTDLPLKGYFYPTHFVIPTTCVDSAQIAKLFPQVTIDLGCGGSYSGIAQQLITIAQYVGYSIPLRETWKPLLKRTNRYILESGLSLSQLHALTEDSVVFYREFGDNFVEAFAALGITEDVPAYVKVDFPMEGRVSFQTTSVMSRCGDASTRVQKYGRYSVERNSEEFFYYLPDDLMTEPEGLKFYWHSTAPATLYLYKDCEKHVVDYDYMNANFVESCKVSSVDNQWATLMPNEVKLMMDAEELNSYCRYSSTYLFFQVQSAEAGVLMLGHQSDATVQMEQPMAHPWLDVVVENRCLRLKSATKQCVRLYNVMGREVASFVLMPDAWQSALLTRGIYILKGDGMVEKIIVN